MPFIRPVSVWPTPGNPGQVGDSRYIGILGCRFRPRAPGGGAIVDLDTPMGIPGEDGRGCHDPAAALAVAECLCGQVLVEVVR